MQLDRSSIEVEIHAHFESHQGTGQYLANGLNSSRGIPFRISSVITEDAKTGKTKRNSCLKPLPQSIFKQTSKGKVRYGQSFSLFL